MCSRCQYHSELRKITLWEYLIEALVGGVLNRKGKEKNWGFIVGSWTDYTGAA
jgi:hypothetical protein